MLVDQGDSGRRERRCRVERFHVARRSVPIWRPPNTGSTCRSIEFDTGLAVASFHVGRIRVSHFAAYSASVTFMAAGST